MSLEWVGKSGSTTKREVSDLEKICSKRLSGSGLRTGTRRQQRHVSVFLYTGVTTRHLLNVGLRPGSESI